MTAPATTPSRRATVVCPFCQTLNRVDLGRVADRPKCGKCGRPILLDRPLAVSDVAFERVVGEADVPVLVDFYAEWCGPCKVMAPVLDALAHDRAGEILVLKLDTDRNAVTTQRFGVRGIPTVIAFRGGREAARQTGAVPRAQLEALVQAAA
ncbi:MAG: thioredoxin [Gemmatimonadales bacterium]